MTLPQKAVFHDCVCTPTREGAKTSKKATKRQERSSAEIKSRMKVP